MSSSTQGNHLNQFANAGIPMMYTMFQGHQTFGSREEDF